MTTHDILVDEDWDDLDRAARTEIEDAIEFDESGTWEWVEALTRFV